MEEDKGKDVPSAPRSLSKEESKKFEVEWRPKHEWEPLPGKGGGGPKGLGLYKKFHHIGRKHL